MFFDGIKKISPLKQGERKYKPALTLWEKAARVGWFLLGMILGIGCTYGYMKINYLSVEAQEAKSIVVEQSVVIKDIVEKQKQQEEEAVKAIEAARRDKSISVESEYDASFLSE